MTGDNLSNFVKATSFRFSFSSSDVVTRNALLQFLAPNAKVHHSGDILGWAELFSLFFVWENKKKSYICNLTKNRQRHLFLTKQATGRLANK